MNLKILLVVAAIAFFFSSDAYCDDKSKDVSEKAQREAAVREGRRLFLEGSCMSCHSVAGKGGSKAPPLDGIAQRRSRKFVAAQIRDPQLHPGLKNKSKMIQPDLFDDQIQQLTAYLMTLPKQPGAKSPAHRVHSK